MKRDSRGRFEKGKSANPAGRPKGIQNKELRDLRGKVNALIEENWQQIEKDLKKLKPVERLNFFSRLLEYSIPKLQRVEQKIEDNRGEADKLQYMNPEELEQYLALMLKAAERKHKIEGSNEKA
ncbi:DUF5681 domain-containing protein [Phaeodactylibacter sp.]|uniref:DUF5681 domain-containing protein n=1 Tax=Phaeodactylibacter sp. TaxID=1940289 RepID=UPI0025E23176|nr:DUF5681 domain-containing protein [Phaeodactylibacter sp.]MCI4647550.1 DUF5681 domain-containing protein [Phaeodactylibacter sp.]MCI5093479.1 DUF5681 domain-containing protein [Phaeodactylibacter sp.]